MATILTFILTPLGRWVAGALGLLFIVFAFAGHQRSIGAAKVVQKMEARANANAEKAETIRRSVQSTPASGLRDAYTRPD